MVFFFRQKKNTKRTNGSSKCLLKKINVYEISVNRPVNSNLQMTYIHIERRIATKTTYAHSQIDLSVENFHKIFLCASAGAFNAVLVPYVFYLIFRYADSNLENFDAVSW